MVYSYLTIIRLFKEIGEVETKKGSLSEDNTEVKGFAGEEEMAPVEGGDALSLGSHGIGQGETAVESLVEPLAVKAVDNIDKRLYHKRIAQEDKTAAIGKIAGTGDQAIGVQLKATLCSIGAGNFRQSITNRAMRGPLFGEEVKTVGPNHEGLAIIVARKIMASFGVIETNGVELEAATGKVMAGKTQDAEVGADPIVVTEVAEIEIVAIESHLFEVVDTDTEVDDRINLAGEGVEGEEFQRSMVVAGPQTSIEPKERRRALSLFRKIADTLAQRLVDAYPLSHCRMGNRQQQPDGEKEKNCFHFEVQNYEKKFKRA